MWVQDDAWRQNDDSAQFFIISERDQKLIISEGQTQFSFLIWNGCEVRFSVTPFVLERRFNLTRMEMFKLTDLTWIDGSELGSGLSLDLG